MSCFQDLSEKNAENVRRIGSDRVRTCVPQNLESAASHNAAYLIQWRSHFCISDFCDAISQDTAGSQAALGQVKLLQSFALLLGLCPAFLTPGSVCGQKLWKIPHGTTDEKFYSRHWRRRTLVHSSECVRSVLCS